MIAILFLLSNLICFYTFSMENEQKWDGAYYSKNSAPQQETGLALVETIKISPYDSPEVLDIGCGSGDITEAFASKYPNALIWAIDNSKDMIKEAKENHSLANITYLEMDAQNLEFEEDKKFHIIFSNATLHWIKDQQKVWYGIAKYLKPSGQVLISMACKLEENKSIRRKILNDMKEQSPWKEYFKDINIHEQSYPQTSDNLKKMICDAGLKIEDIQLKQPIRHFESVEKLKSFIHGWIGGVSVMAKADAEIRKKFVDDFVECYKKYSPVKENGSIDYLSSLIIAKATKE